ncbi:MAG: hypothetical protein Q8K18_15110 [Burkholderiales bacterium]|nr:hypothetical protein [Burkholderiales bacterium]
MSVRAKRVARRSTRGKRVTRSAWSRHVEQATLTSGDDLLRDAKAAFDRIRDPALQMRLAYEIADTRARELCLAYKNVVMVAAGYRMKRAARGATKIEKTPCVTFVVRRKWKGKGPASQRQQRLPSHLFTYTGLDGAQALCAVPTDVVIEQGFSRAKPQAPSGIVADGEVGNATCAAVLQVGNRRDLVILTCQHVLTPERTLNTPQPLAGTQVVLLNDTSIPLALTSSNGGQIRSDSNPSFDVQLTGPANPDALRSALHGLSLSPGREYLSDKSSFDAIANSTQFSMLVSPNNPPKRVTLPATFVRYVANVQGIPYRFIINANGDWQERPVNHRLLIMFRILSAQKTEGGDSGSPIVMRLPGGKYTLVGMHIAGGIEGGFAYSYAIPAWLLFNWTQYSHLPPGATLAPVNA